MTIPGGASMMRKRYSAEEVYSMQYIDADANTGADRRRCSKYIHKYIYIYIYMHVHVCRYIHMHVYVYAFVHGDVWAWGAYRTSGSRAGLEQVQGHRRGGSGEVVVGTRPEREGGS